MKLKIPTLFSNQVLYVCLATDIVFVIIHGLYILNDGVSNDLLKISLDRGYAEIFQYIKTYWIVLILLVMAFRHRSLLYFLWSGLFTYLLLDDSLEIHETWGLAIGQALSFPSLFGLSPHDLGEITVSLTFGLGFLSLIALNYRFSKSFERHASRYLVYMLIALGVVGIVADSIHVMVPAGILKPVFTTLEDGGEMVIMSLILSFIWLLPARGQLSQTKYLY